MAEKKSFEAALSRAMALCSRMEYCRDDIRRKSRDWGLTDDECEKILKYLLKENFINEERYARAFTRDKFRYNKWGRLKIAAHLKSKNIDPETIRSALAEIDDDEYLGMLKNLIASHKKTIKAKNEYDLRGKLLRFGASRGFESNLLYEIINASPQTPEWEGL
jgi:regulatory protein